jgi:hypothetical protein
MTTSDAPSGVDTSPLSPHLSTGRTPTPAARAHRARSRSQSLIAAGAIVLRVVGCRPVFETAGLNLRNTKFTSSDVVYELVS